MMANSECEKRAEEQARAQLDSIIEMIEALHGAADEDREEAERAIRRDPLSVRIRSGWLSPGTEIIPEEFEEFVILLRTGGPAVRLIGDLDEHCEPESVKIQYQDWSTSWCDYQMTEEEEEAAMAYVCQFYFKE